MDNENDTNRNVLVTTEDELKRVVKSTVKETLNETLIQLGVDVNNPLEVQRDLQCARDVRQTLNSIKGKFVLTTVVILLGSLATAVWAGIITLVKKGP
ncbi:MAG: hypothetical protein KAR40_06000 [Candidatus Sabulitectum sp.]|nr:hypothetical protein [Candidatus Sabulitectum sp.]